eukprot:m.116308 g.116308  ORF g.116308 m.116308 type:complete len:199 (-) comp51938_c0_seq4:190-786(-)
MCNLWLGRYCLLSGCCTWLATELLLRRTSLVLAENRCYSRIFQNSPELLGQDEQVHLIALWFSLGVWLRDLLYWLAQGGLGVLPNLRQIALVLFKNLNDIAGAPATSQVDCGVPVLHPETSKSRKLGIELCSECESRRQKPADRERSRSVNCLRRTSRPSIQSDLGRCNLRPASETSARCNSSTDAERNLHPISGSSL